MVDLAIRVGQRKYIDYTVRLYSYWSEKVLMPSILNITVYFSGKLPFQTY